MALNVKNPEADRLARELAAKPGETISEGESHLLNIRTSNSNALGSQNFTLANSV